MSTKPSTSVVAGTRDSALDATWQLLLTASAMATDLEASHRSAQLEGLLTWTPGAGWVSSLPSDDERAAFIDLYLPLCSATALRPMTVGHLGQSLDGFIATHSGDSQFVTGEHNILHMHRMRALSDAVVIGAGTVAADDPQLTTRLVPGPNPIRVILDQARRLEPSHRIFTDAVAPTLYVCSSSQVRPGETHVGHAQIVGIDDDLNRHAEIVRLLRERGCSRIFVEGGGITVSAFLDADLLDRLQIAVAPLLIGDGRPAVRLPPQTSLRDCRRPPYRVFRMGGDVLFDCSLTPTPRGEADVVAEGPPVSRII